MAKWGFITGLLLVVIFKMGPLGFFVGVILGIILYSAIKKGGGENSADKQHLFLTIMFEVAGHMSKSKGIVTQTDIQIATQIMDRLKFDNMARKAAQDAFTRGKNVNYPLSERVSKLYHNFKQRKSLLNIFLEFQIQLAVSDGILSDQEKRILYTIADVFNLSRQHLELMINMMLGGQKFNQQEEFYYGSKNYGSSSHYQSSALPSLQDAFKVLGIIETDDIKIIKRAYRKLMNEYHPDKLVSKGLPPEVIEVAKQRTQEIQAAYDLIKSKLGFK